ncbi:MAG: tetratricopeptide repeat protein [Cellulomonadaceae bacterium]|nr:tetratricopeptide repeat protein [Cellulomonadaceae bacterium]
MSKTKVRTIQRIAALLVGAALAGVVAFGCSPSGGDSSPTSGVSDTASPGSGEANLEEQMLNNGIAQAEQGRYDDAVATFTALLALNPESQYALYNLGLIAYMRGDLEQAVSYYDRALAIDPTWTSAMYNKAIALETLNPEQAIDLYEQIVVIDPEASTAFWRLSFLLEAAGDTERAQSTFQQAIDLDPSLETMDPPERPSSEEPADGDGEGQ